MLGSLDAVGFGGGKITSPGFSYQITDQDKLWAARMLVGEGGPVERDPAAILWTMTQLFTPQGQASRGRARYTPLSHLFQRYSQPINPLWFSGVPGSKCHLRPSACTPRHEERRRRLRGLRWSQIPENIRRIVDKWASGNLPNPVPGAVEFADSAQTRRWLASHPGGEWVQPRGFRGGERGTCPDPPCNYFLANRVSKNWPAGFVKVSGGSNLAQDLYGATLFGLASTAVLLVVKKRNL